MNEKSPTTYGPLGSWLIEREWDGQMTVVISTEYQASSSNVKIIRRWTSRSGFVNWMTRLVTRMLAWAVSSTSVEVRQTQVTTTPPCDSVRSFNY